MKDYFRKIFVIALVLSGFIGVVETRAQTTKEPVAKRNFPFAPNPKRKAETEKPIQPVADIQQKTAKNSNLNNIEKVEPQIENQTIATKTLEIAKRKRAVSTQPTEIYRVGAGDVLDIKILNSEANGSTLFTVLENGTIDYPLAGSEPINVEKLTPEEIETILSEKVKLYENTEIAVTVRNYESHKISVLGLVERPGTKALRREAIPLYVILAEAIPLSSAEKVSILRGADKETISVSLEDSETLVYANDIIRVAAEEVKPSMAQTQFYYIGGEISAGGQKDFHDGITLTQAILASGGLKKSSTRKVTIRRKNAEGLLEATEFDLKAIKDGKIVDPQLQSGDTIEVGN